MEWTLNQKVSLTHSESMVQFMNLHYRHDRTPTLQHCRWAVLLIVSLGLSACASTLASSNKPTITAATAAEQLTQARVAFERSVELGFAWVATGKQIRRAELALAAGDVQAASAAAAEALALANASITQAQTESTAWQTRGPFQSAKPSDQDP